MGLDGDPHLHPAGAGGWPLGPQSGHLRVPWHHRPVQSRHGPGAHLRPGAGVPRSGRGGTRGVLGAGGGVRGSPGAAAVAVVEHVSWRWIYGALAALAIAIAIGVRAALPADVPAVPGAAAREGSPWREKRLVGPLALSVVALIFVFSHFVVYTYATVIFTDPAGTLDPRLSIYLAIIGVASIIGLIISGPLANRWPRYGLVAYLLIFALGMVLIIPTSLGARFTGFALWGLMFGTIGPVSQALALRFTPERLRATVSAAMVVTFNLGISLGSFAGGVLIDSTGARAGPHVAAGALVLGGMARLLGRISAARGSTSRYSCTEPGLDPLVARGKDRRSAKPCRGRNRTWGGIPRRIHP